MLPFTIASKYPLVMPINLSALLNHLDLFLQNIYMHFQAFDQHLNMILSEVEETITTVEIDEETFEELFKVRYTQ